MQQLGRSLRAAAADARAGGAGVTDGMRQIATQLEAARAESAKLNNEMKNSSGAFGSLNKAIREPLEGLAMMKSSLRETAELAGAVFAVEEMKKFAIEMAELGEKALNTSFALAISLKDLAQLQGVFVLAGGSADDAQRTFERLGRSVHEALVSPNSEARRAFENLGISMADLRSKGGDLLSLLQLLIERYSELRPSLQNIGELHAVAGRQVDSMIPVLRQGAEGYQELAEKARDYQRAMVEATPLEAKTAEALNELKLDSMTLAHDGFVALEEPIRVVTELLDSLVRVADIVAQTFNAAGKAIGELYKGIYKFTGGWLGDPTGGGFGSDLNLDLNVKGTRPLGNAGPKGKSGGASNVSLWREQLQAQLTAEHDFYGDSTGEEIAFWQSKVSLTKAGSKDQAEVLNTIFELQKRQARQTEEEVQKSIQTMGRANADIARTFEERIKIQVGAGKLTPAQGFGFDIEEISKLAAEQKARLDAVMSGPDAKARVDAYWQEWDLGTHTQAQIAQIQEQMAAAGREAAAKFAEPFIHTFDGIGTALTDALEGALEHRPGLEIAKAFHEQLIKSLVGGGEDIFSKVAAGPLSALLGQKYKAGEGVGDVFGTAITGVVTQLLAAIGIQTPSIISNTAALTANTAALSTAGAGSTVGGIGSGIGGIGNLASGAGFLGKIGGFIGSLFGSSSLAGDAAGLAAGFFSRGGIVPSAASGWSLPSSFGSDRVISALTPGETVLPVGERPSQITRNLAGMLERGGAGDVHLHFGGPADAAGIERMMLPMLKRQLPELVRAAFRNNALSPSSI